MDVSNLWEAGESKAVLYSGNAIVGYVIASNDRFAMNITVQSDNGTSDIRLVNGKNAALTFKNNDAVSYPVRWTMRLKGKEFIGSTVNLGANGAAFVEFKPPAEWFPSSFFTLFKDEEQNAEVILTYAPEPSTGASFLPTKHIPVKVHLSAMQDGSKQPIGYGLVLILLLAGGITSLVLSFGLPNRLQRLTLKERLEKVTATISAISRGVDSRLRVLMRVERKRLDEQLGSRWAFSPDLTDVFVQVDAGISALSAKVDVVDQLDQRRGILTDLIFKGDLGPSLVVQIDAVLQQCADLLRQPQTTNDDLAAARTLLGKADQLLSEKGQTEQAAQDLAKRVEALDQALAPYRATATYARLEFRFACLFAELNPLNKDPKNIKPADIARLDNAISRLELLQQFIRRAECHSIDQSALASPPDSPLSYPLSGPWGPFSYFDSSPPQLAVDPNERFLAQFDSESWESFREARLFLRELRAA